MIAIGPSRILLLVFIFAIVLISYFYFDCLSRESNTELGTYRAKEATGPTAAKATQKTVTEIGDKPPTDSDGPFAGFRKPNSLLRITDLPSTSASYELVRVYPDLSLRQITFVIDSTIQDCLFIGQRNGKIYSFRTSNTRQTTRLELFLDIESKVDSDGERCLLGMAVDPDFCQTGTFYVTYSSLPSDTENYGPTVLSRFKTLEHERLLADPSSEEVVMSIPQNSRQHKGGAIAFGNDNMLYVSIGNDEPPRRDVSNSQDTSNLKGAILRIDVHSAPNPQSDLNYVIPDDNPFYFSHSPTTKKEIYAYGFRNVWRFSFDKLSGELYAADVGHVRYEEINRVIAGGNYGWPVYEGKHLKQRGQKNDGNSMLPPFADYSHVTNGAGGKAAVIGGFVYRGRRIPELNDMYIFGDFASNKVYGVKTDSDNATDVVTLVESELRIFGFYQDSEGEIYVYGAGPGIYAIRRQPPRPNSEFPRRLSEVTLLLQAGLGRANLQDGVIPYAPNSKLWSDGAIKERFFALPDFEHERPPYAQIVLSDDSGWDFPDHTVVIKNFLLPLDLREPESSAKRIETRLLVKHSGKWFGFSYEWNEGETDAFLLETAKKRKFSIIEKSGERVDYHWHYPSRSECMQCHTKGSNYLLGLNTAQMNRRFHYSSTSATRNQLELYDELQLFNNGLPLPPKELPRMSDPCDESVPVYLRARAYLAANCSHCHQPGGTAVLTHLGNGLNLLWNASAIEMNAIEENLRAYNNPGVSYDNSDINKMKLIKPRDPDHSMVRFRMSTLNPHHRMPPLGTSRIDQFGVNLIENWIANLDYRVMGEVALFWLYPNVGDKNKSQIRFMGYARDWRKSIVVHSPSELRFPAITVQAGDSLEFGIGTVRSTWAKPGDGIEFSILAQIDQLTDDKGPNTVLLFSKYIDPKKNPDERRWLDERVSLDRFANSKVQLILRTASGPLGNEHFDRAAWSILRVSSDLKTTPL